MDSRESRTARETGDMEETPFSVAPERPANAPMFTGDASAWPLLIGAIILGVWVEAGIGNSPMRITVFLLLVGAIILEMAFYRKRNRDHIQAKVAEWTRLQIAEHEKMAQDLTQQASATRKNFYMGLASLPEFLNKADASLRIAEKEFDERAYVPFWSHIEQAALNLASFNSTIARIEALGHSYNQLLSGRIHSFPSLAIQPSDIPDPSPQAERLRYLVGVGHRDFEFASIWGQRKTQTVIIDGFRILGQAVDNFGWNVEDHLSRVSKAIEESFSGVREEQIRFRETFEDAVREWEEQKRLNEAGAPNPALDG